MDKPKVFITRRIPEAGLKLIDAVCDAVVWQEALPPTRAVLIENCRGVAGILSMLSDKIDDEVMQAAGSGLRVISNYAVGFDNIDLAAATARHIAVGNTPGVLTDATADMAFALMMSAGRRIVEADAMVRQGRWKTWGPSILLGVDFVGKTLGIIGYGRIGQAMAKRAAGFEMRVIYYDPTAEPVSGINAEKVDDLDALICQSDFISLHVPLTPKTHHLINDEKFAIMKPNVVLINTARGAIIDSGALYRALASNRIFAAGLDVTDPEPIPVDDPLLTLENIVIAPHIASASHYTRTKMAQMAAENLLAGLNGERLPHCVNPAVYG